LNFTSITCILQKLYGLLHGIEVTLRNAIHHTLTASYGAADRYDRAGLSSHWAGKISEAKSSNAGTVTPGKIIAGMTNRLSHHEPILNSRQYPLREKCV
jgi:hypothetical protein